MDGYLNEENQRVEIYIFFANFWFEPLQICVYVCYWNKGQICVYVTMFVKKNL